MAGTINSFVAPSVLVMLLLDLSERGWRRAGVALHVIMTVNASIATVEFIIHTRFFPYRFNGAVFPTDTRSTALLGHPLANAAITACYVLALLNGNRVLTWTLKLPLILLQSAALVAFGGLYRHRRHGRSRRILSGRRTALDPAARALVHSWRGRRAHAGGPHTPRCRRPCVGRLFRCDRQPICSRSQQ